MPCALAAAAFKRSSPTAAPAYPAGVVDRQTNTNYPTPHRFTAADPDRQWNDPWIFEPNRFWPLKIRQVSFKRLLKYGKRGHKRRSDMCFTQIEDPCGTSKGFHCRPSATDGVAFHQGYPYSVRFRFAQAPVIASSEGRVAQNVVGFLDLQERRAVFTVTVGVILFYSAAISGFYFFSRGSGMDTEDGIIVFPHYHTPIDQALALICSCGPRDFCRSA